MYVIKKIFLEGKFLKHTYSDLIINDQHAWFFFFLIWWFSNYLLPECIFCVFKYLIYNCNFLYGSFAIINLRCVLYILALYQPYLYISASVSVAEKHPYWITFIFKLSIAFIAFLYELHFDVMMYIKLNHSWIPMDIQLMTKWHTTLYIIHFWNWILAWFEYQFIQQTHLI